MSSLVDVTGLLVLRVGDFEATASNEMVSDIAIILADRT
jgi:hypothetical protein